MQSAMNNNTNLNPSSSMDKKPSENTWTGKTQIDNGINKGISKLESLVGDTDLKSVATDLTNRAGELTSKVRGVSGDLFNDSVSFVKRYPVGSALGLCAVGYLIGAFTARSKN